MTHLTRHGALVVAAVWFAALNVVIAPTWIAADTWLAFVDGREIVRHGLPDEAAALLASGSTWVDQQWLAHVALYGLVSAGGLALVVAAHLVAVAAAFALALWGGLRRGATTAACAVVAIPIALLIVPNSFVRAQTFAYPLFVVLLLLLSSEARHRTWRAALAFPLLVLWANVHGSVLVAAAMTSLLGVTEAIDVARRRSGRAEIVRATALTLLPWACVLATPYGLKLVDYYQSTVGNPALRAHLTEWQTPSAVGVWWFFPIAGAVALLALHRRRFLAGFDAGVLVLTLLASLAAMRSIVWFGYAALVLAPPLLAPLLHSARPPRLGRPVRAVAALSGAFVAAVLAGGSLDDARAAVGQTYPDAVAAAVRSHVQDTDAARVYVVHDPSRVVFEVPELHGRTAFDGHWEALAPATVDSAASLVDPALADWNEQTRGYDLIVADSDADGAIRGQVAGARLVVRDDGISVWRRG
jgi:hypothetical protein